MRDRLTRIVSSTRFVPVVVFLVCWTLTTHGKYSVTGDEPHYLLVSESLLRDGDLDLRNNYDNGDSRRFGVDGLRAEQHARIALDGDYVTVHDIGLSIVLLPPYAAATWLAPRVSAETLRAFRMNQGLFAYSLLTLCIIAVTAAAAAWSRRAIVAAGVSPPAATATVLATWLSPPVLSNSFGIFPEPFALLATAWALRVATRSSVGLGALLRFAFTIGLLSWMHRKYAIYGIALLAAVAIYRHRHQAQHHAPLEWIAALAACALPQAALACWMWLTWGHPGGALVLDGTPFSWQAFSTGALGLLVDRENGLFVWAPIYLMLPALWASRWREQWAWIVPCGVLYVMSASHLQWWAGFSPVGRFLVPMVPLFAFVSAPGLMDRSMRRAALVLLVPQALISAYGWQNPRALWPQGDGENRALAALAPPIERALPSLRLTPPDILRALLLLAALCIASAGALSRRAWRGGRLER